MSVGEGWTGKATALKVCYMHLNWGLLDYASCGPNYVSFTNQLGLHADSPDGLWVGLRSKVIIL